MIIIKMFDSSGGNHDPARRSCGGWLAFLAHFLIILSAWTLVIKYIFPITYAAFYGLPLTRHVFWDLWPVFHVWLAWLLLSWRTYTPRVAIWMSVIEIVIILTLFTRFLSGPDPEWTIWRTNWFINKIFVLACFIMILTTFTLFRRYVDAWRESNATPQNT